MTYHASSYSRPREYPRVNLAHDRSKACEQAPSDTLDTTVFIDLRGVTNITSSCIALFMETMQKITSRGGRLVFVGVHEEVRRVFETARLDQVFSIAPTREDALARDRSLSAQGPS